MELNHIKVFSFRKGVLLALISYALYTVLWLLIDRDVFIYSGSVTEIAVDFLVCSFFSFLSLATSHLIFKTFRFRAGFKWSLFYGGVLFLVNNITAIIMNQSFQWMYGETQDPLFKVQGIYSFAMVSTLISSIYIIEAFMNNYNKAIEDKHETEIMLMKEKEIALEAQLNSLKMQINPHFLFNNFSTLSGLIETDPETAGSFLSHLSKVYRHIVRNLNVNLIDVSEETAFLDSYIYLMKLRHGEGVIITIHDSVREGGHKIPPASLQLLVENAIKHNAFSVDNPLRIDIMRIGDRLVVRNPVSPMASAPESTGVGLSNIVSRYALLCPAEVIIENSDNFFTVSLPLL